MPNFRVTLSRYIPLDPNRNPFYVRDVFSFRSRRIDRVWEFDADSEPHVKRLLAEARTMDLYNVRGFELSRIEEVKPAPDDGLPQEQK